MPLPLTAALVQKERIALDLALDDAIDRKYSRSNDTVGVADTLPLLVALSRAALTILDVMTQELAVQEARSLALDEKRESQRFR